MQMEIERKFLVTSNVWKAQARAQYRIVQGYLCSVPERTVRIRIKGESGFITVKGMTGKAGMSRLEWEKEVPLAEAEQLLTLCEPGIIEKIRYEVPDGGHVFEVDEFQGDNAGLVIAEIELSAEDEGFPRPEWLGREVTGDNRYYNAMLASQPFKSWVGK
jgi:adenylate cyclase